MSIFWQFWLILVGIIALYQVHRIMRNYVLQGGIMPMQDMIIHILFILVFLDIGTACITAAFK